MHMHRMQRNYGQCVGLPSTET